jgi:multidrug transporter EmrE-like cation transporter
MILSNLTVIGILSLIILAEIGGQSCLKKLHHEPDKPYLFFAALAFYACICFLLWKSYSFKNMGTMNALWSSMSVLTIFTAGILLFNEPLTPGAFVGAVLVISGMACIFVS